MSSFFRKLFGGHTNETQPEAAASDPEIYKDCSIVARPIREGSQWRLAGTISKVVDGQSIERTFIRADLFASQDEARSFTVRKGQQIIDENGPALFSGNSTGTA